MVPHTKKQIVQHKTGHDSRIQQHLPHEVRHQVMTYFGIFRLLSRSRARHDHDSKENKKNCNKILACSSLHVNLTLIPNVCRCNTHDALFTACHVPTLNHLAKLNTLMTQQYDSIIVPIHLNVGITHQHLILYIPLTCAGWLYVRFYALPE